MRHAVAVLGSAVTELDALQSQSDALAMDLRRQHDEIAQLLSHGAQLERAIAPLRIIDTLFRIEAATLPTEMQQAFAAVTHQISELDVQVRDTFSRHFRALAVTRATIGGVVQHLESQRAEHERSAAAQRLAIRDSLHHIETGLNQFRQRTDRTSALVRDIDRECNAVVVGVQYQDITRQKLEHVDAALEAMTNRAAERGAGRFVSQSARLQAAQLAAIETDLDQALRQMRSGLQGVVARLRDAEASCFDCGEGNRAGVEITVTIDALSAMLPTVKAAVERIAGNGTAAAQAVDAVGGVAADFGTSISELTWGIRLIALNAQVQAAQVARCDGLEVLARHTYTVSDETAALAEKLGRSLAELSGRLQTVAESAQTFARRTTELRAGFARDFAILGPALAQQRAAVVAVVEEFSPLLRQAREHAARLADDAQLERLGAEPLLTLRVELESLATWCAEHSGMKSSAGVGEFSALQRTYTMESERVIHDQVLGGAEPIERPDPGPSASHPGSGDPSPGPDVPAAALGANVELF